MFTTFLRAVSDQFVVPVIFLLMGAALLVFLWGLVELIRDSASDQGRTKGKQHILYGIIGLFVMTSAWALINVIANSIPDDTGRNAIPDEFKL